MDILNGAHVQTAGGLHRNKQLGVLVDLPGDDRFLLVAAGHGTGHGDGALTGTDVILLNQPLGIGADVLPAEEAELVGELRLKIPLQDHIVFQRVVQHQAVLVAILRNVAHAQNAAAADGRVGDVHAAHGDRAAGRGFQTGYGIYQLALAVAVNARDADDLARVYLKADVFDCVVLMDFGGNGEVLHIQNHLRRVRLALGDCEFHVTADHHPGQLCLGGIRDVHGAHVLALAQNGAAVGNRHDLVELVGDKEDGFPFRREIAHDLQQLLNLLRGQHGGGLVENQDLVVPV